MIKLTTHAQIIDQWPTRAEFGRAIGVTPRNATHMAARGIPAKRFDDVVAAVARAGFPPVTYQELAAMGPPKRKYDATKGQGKAGRTSG
jgi:hypothetical protein